MSSAEKIQKLFTESNVTVGSNVDDRIIRAALTALDESEEAQSTSAGPYLRRITMKVKITKLAAAAAIMIAVLVGIHLLGGSPDGTGVAWADVAKKMESINSFTCRMTSWEKSAAMPDGLESSKKTTMRFMYSDELGFKMEQYTDGDLSLVVCMLRQSNEGARVWPKEKRYIRGPLSEEDRAVMSPQEMDPRQWIRRFMAVDFTPLGQDLMDGVTVEGVEINDPGVMRTNSGGPPLKDYVARLWVDVDSLLPVRIEEEYTLGTVRGGGGADQFEWSASLTALDIEPDIPRDYTLMQ